MLITIFFPSLGHTEKKCKLLSESQFIHLKKVFHLLVLLLQIKSALVILNKLRVYSLWNWLILFELRIIQKLPEIFFSFLWKIFFLLQLSMKVCSLNFNYSVGLKWSLKSPQIDGPNIRRASNWIKLFIIFSY